ncbi:N-terminal nucleophile aminohydrolase [Obba rivulosa]|uniref:N-terminal nucleophile aminohydrolase n=1 Tax=Obba rivulosa TaxID=1052685 RepID=A0A8E2DSU0_9APHY|nr:N-terminal nucleophile aminohydrolase [Obba rivulosa]
MVVEEFYLIAVHGGAGHHSPSRSSDAEIKKVLKSACRVALSTLAEGTSALHAVENAMTVLENDECLNAGCGSNLTLNGDVECDASIMDGETGDFGAIGAVSGIRNPVRLARAVLEHSRNPDSFGRIPPLLLVGPGATQFARTSGIEVVAPECLIALRAHRQWAHWKSIVEAASDISKEHRDTLHAIQDTVGAVAWDKMKGMSAGVSSGGLLLKHPGRIGEAGAATYGAGCWASLPSDTTRGVSCSVSGAGEYIMRSMLAKKVADAVILSGPNETHDVLQHVLRQFYEDCRARGEHNPHAGIILLLREQNAEGVIVPRLWCAFTTESMAVAYASSLDAKPQVRPAIRKHPNFRRHLTVGVFAFRRLSFYVERNNAAETCPFSSQTYH